MAAAHDRVIARSSWVGDCLICDLTPRSRYPRVRVDGCTRLAHRVVYEHHHGPLPSPEVVVRHSCDTPRCVNVAHLLAGTQADNVADAVGRGRHAQGSMFPQSKLTEAAVVDIRERRARGETARSLAIEYDVSEPQMSAILRGREWTHAGGPILTHHGNRKRATT